MTTNGRTRDPREIEADLDRTRAQMGDTLEALQRKLSPGELFDQVLEQFRSGSGGEFTSNFKHSVTQNPVPLTMVGLGLAWLMISGRSSASSHAGARVSSMASGASDKTKAAADSARAGLGSARDSLGRIARGSREHVHQLSHGASRVSAISREKAAGAKSAIEYMLNEQPLVLGAIGAALGAVLAAGLPRTSREDEFMGATRDEMVERARTTGEEQMNKARQVAESARDAAIGAATQAAKDEANRQGLGDKTADQPSPSDPTTRRPDI